MISRNKVMALVGVVSVIIAVALFTAAFKMEIVYVISWTLAVVAIALVLTEILYKSIKKELTPVSWQIIIYGILAIAGWIGATLSSTWGWCSASMALFVGALTMMIGTFIMKRGVKEEIQEQDKKEEAKKPEDLLSTLRYKFIDDDMSKAFNLDEPICLVDGKALTVEEAEKAGAKDVALKGKQYIENLKKGEK